MVHTSHYDLEVCQHHCEASADIASVRSSVVDGGIADCECPVQSHCHPAVGSWIQLRPIEVPAKCGLGRPRACARQCEGGLSHDNNRRHACAGNPGIGCRKRRIKQWRKVYFSLC